MNVQHLESLNDIITQVIGVKVNETVPDTLIDKAEEIKLIDLPPEELIKRLHEGKVYVKDIVGIAVEKYFRPGNLLALREMALRSVAGTVDERMRQYMKEYAISEIWPAKERVLVAVYASLFAEKLVRSAYRLATEMDAELIAIHVETEKNTRFSDEEKGWLTKALNLAKKLGARTVWIKGNDIAEEISDYARKHNVTKVVIGKPHRHKFWPTLSSSILHNTPNIDVYLMDPGSAKVTYPPRLRRKTAMLISYFTSTLIVAAIALFAFVLRDALNQVDLLFLFLIPPILSALFLGRGPSVFASILSIVAFDYLFVNPYYSFNVNDFQYFISFVIYFGTVVIISNLALGRRNKVKLLKESESKNIALFGLSRDLITAENQTQVLTIMIRHAKQIFNCEVAIFLPKDGKLEVMGKSRVFDINAKIRGVASWAFINRQMAGRGSNTLPEAQALFIPMTSGKTVVGVMGIWGKEDVLADPDQQIVLDTFASLGAMALERITK